MKKEKPKWFKSTFSVLVVTAFALLSITACNTGLNTPVDLEDIQIAVNFNPANRSISRSAEIPSYTPKAYSIGIKKAVLTGSGDTSDFILFDNTNLSDSESFDFLSSNNKTKSLLTTGNTIPVGTYNSLTIELYYLQMTIDVYLAGETTPVDRALRIYFSDDAETEGGLHQPGDVTAINSDGIETGWLMGNAYGDFTGLSPRTAAYQDNSVWMDFAGKDAADFGPFGDVAFWQEVDQPIFKTAIEFDLNITNSRAILVEFDVVDTWNCDDVNGDGKFNPEDIGGSWHMSIPAMTASSME